MIMDKDTLQNKMTELKNYFASHEDISTVFLFGSYGTDYYDPDRSDLDLAIIFKRNLSLKEEMLVDAEISIILGQDEVDITNLNKARVDISHQILSTGEIIYEENKLVTADFIEKTLKHYFDYGIPLSMMKADFFEALKEESRARDR